MAETYGPFDGVPWSQGQWFDFAPTWAPSGVVGTPAASYNVGELALAVNGLNLTLGTGRAWVRGAGYKNDAGKGFEVTANANASLARRDRIVLRRDVAAKTVTAIRLEGTPASTPAAPALTQSETGAWDEPLFSFLVPANSGTTLTGFIDERRWLTPDGSGLMPTTLRNVGRQSNNVLSGGSQGYGSSSAGRIVVPAAANARLARIDVDIDVWCPSTSASAGSVRLYANSTELLPNPADWGSFHNLVATNTYAARPATAHIRWEGTLPAAAQNLWVNVVSDAGTAAFWVTGFDMTAVYR